MSSSYLSRPKVNGGSWVFNAIFPWPWYFLYKHPWQLYIHKNCCMTNYIWSSVMVKRVFKNLASEGCFAYPWVVKGDPVFYPITETLKAQVGVVIKEVDHAAVLPSTIFPLKNLKICVWIPDPLNHTGSKFNENYGWKYHYLHSQTIRLCTFPPRVMHRIKK